MKFQTNVTRTRNLVGEYHSHLFQFYLNLGWWFYSWCYILLSSLLVSFILTINYNFLIEYLLNKPTRRGDFSQGIQRTLTRKVIPCRTPWNKKFQRQCWSCSLWEAYKASVKWRLGSVASFVFIYITWILFLILSKYAWLIDYNFSPFSFFF